MMHKIDQAQAEARRILQEHVQGPATWEGTPKSPQTAAAFRRIYGIPLQGAPAVVTFAGWFWRLHYIYAEHIDPAGNIVRSSERAFYLPFLAHDGRLPNYVYNRFYRSDFTPPRQYAAQLN